MMIKQILGGIPKNPIKFENSNDYQQSNAINLVYEPLPGFDDVSSAAEKQDLFIKKLNMCCVIFDFTDMTKNLTEKDVKRRTLLELVEYVNSANSKFPEIIMKEVMRMISLNLFRALSPSNKGVEDFETDEDEASMEPTWLHLHAVYELLLRFITSPETDVKLAKRYIDQLTVLKLLELFDSEDQREREYLKAILHRMYGKFTVHRPFIRRAVNNIFFQLIFEIENHNGIAEILEILGSIINGFALPLKEEHKLFLIKVLIPLHKPKSLPSYHRQLSHCIAQFVDKDCKLADCVIRGMLKYWPLTNSSKEVMFLVELEQILDLTEIPEFQRCMIPLFQQIGSCISSPHFQVAERALFLWNNDRIENMIRQNISVILPIVLPALERNKNHWNRTVQSLTLSVRKIIYDHDLELIRGCISKLHEAEMREMEITRKRDARWKCLEEIAENKITISFIQLFNDN